MGAYLVEVIELEDDAKDHRKEKAIRGQM